MAICRYFEEIIAAAEKSEMPKAFKSQIIAGLRYFLQQSLCDFNRRDTKAEIKARWIDLETLLLGTSFLDRFKDNKSHWSEIELFVGYSNKAPVQVPARPTKPKSRIEGKDAEQLIEYLARKLEGKPVISESEQKVVQFGLYYLYLESKRGRGQRDNKRIQITWKTIQPILRRMGFLDEFDREPETIKKIKSFVADKFL